MRFMFLLPLITCMKTKISRILVYFLVSLSSLVLFVFSLCSYFSILFKLFPLLLNIISLLYPKTLFYLLYYDISFGSTVSHTLQLKETDLGSFLEIGDDEINAIELDMRIRLAELQRLYKEKQKLYAKLQPKKSEKEKDRVEYVTLSC